MIKNTYTKWRWLTSLFLVSTLGLPALADVRLAGIFSSHMVLQRGRAIVIWGWADRGERVSITLNNVIYFWNFFHGRDFYSASGAPNHLFNRTIHDGSCII